MPLLAALVTAAALFTGAIVAGGPPPQPPFDYPPPFSAVGGTPTNVPRRAIAECARAGASLPLYPPQKPGQLAYQWVGYTGWAGKSLRRPRIALARRPEQMRRWLYLADPAPGYVFDRKRLADVDFGKCSLLALFVPGNVDVSVLGIR